MAQRCLFAQGNPKYLVVALSNSLLIPDTRSTALTVHNIAVFAPFEKKKNVRCSNGSECHY
jgi:hypothetical protein